jgi:WD40 repeat protein
MKVCLAVPVDALVEAAWGDDPPPSAERTLREPDTVLSAAFSTDGRAVFGVDDHGQLVRWSAAGGLEQAVLHLGHVGNQIAVAGDGSLVVGYWSDSSVPSLAMLDPTGTRLLAQLPNVQERGWALSQDRRYAVFIPGSQDTPSSVVGVWRLGSAVATVRRVTVGGPVDAVAACGPDTACALTDGGHLVRIRVAEATVEGRVDLPPDTLPTFVGSPDGHILAIARPDGVVRLVDPRSGRVLRELGGAFRDPHPLAFSPDGHQLVAGDFDTLLVWHTDRDGLPERHDVFGGRIAFATWSADGGTLAAGSGSSVVLLDATGRHRVGAVITDAIGEDTSTLWAVPGAIIVGQGGGRLLFVDPATGKIHTETAPIRDPAHTPPEMRLINTARAGQSGRLLVTTNLAGDTAVWDVASHRLLGMVNLPPWQPTGPYPPDAWVSPDGSKAATIRTDAGPIVFDPATRKVLRQLPPLPGPKTSFTVAVAGWTSDGRSILIIRRLTMSHSDLLVVDATTGAVKLRADTGPSEAEEATEDPSGRFIALGMLDGTLWILDAKNGRALAPPLRAADASLINVSISPDSRYIATSSAPPTVTVWDARTFRRVGIPLPLDANAPDARARFAPDSRLIVTTGSVLRAFTIDPSEWLTRACREAGSTLTRSEFEEVLPGRRYAPACS